VRLDRPSEMDIEDNDRVLSGITVPVVRAIGLPYPRRIIPSEAKAGSLRNRSVARHRCRRRQWHWRRWRRRAANNDLDLAPIGNERRAQIGHRAASCSVVQLHARGAPREPGSLVRCVHVPDELVDGLLIRAAAPIAHPQGTALARRTEGAVASAADQLLEAVDEFGRGDAAVQVGIVIPAQCGASEPSFRLELVCEQVAHVAVRKGIVWVGQRPRGVARRGLGGGEADAVGRLPPCEAHIIVVGGDADEIRRAHSGRVRDVPDLADCGADGVEVSVLDR